MASFGFIPRFRTLARLGRAALSLVLAVQIISPSLIVAGPLPAGAPPKYPEWWFKRDVVPRLNSQTISPVWPMGYPGMDDYSAANLGQLKAIATAAYDELQTNLPGGAGTAATNLVKSWFQTDVNGNFILDAQGRRQPKASAPTDDFAAANLGQLKAVAKPFYDTLILRDYATAYPWANGTADNFAMANLGQLKSLFSFDVNKDTDHDGLPDWWEKAFFGPGGLNLPLSPAQRAALALGGSWGSNPYNPQTGTANPGGPLVDFETDPDPNPLLKPTIVDISLPPTEGEDEVDYTKAVVTWTGAGATAYLLERKDGPANWTQIGSFGGTAHEYTDHSLLANRHYQYRVTSIRDIGGRAISDSRSYSIPLIVGREDKYARAGGDKGPFFKEYIDGIGQFFLRKDGSADWGATFYETWDPVLLKYALHEEDVFAGEGNSSHYYYDYTEKLPAVHSLYSEYTSNLNSGYTTTSTGTDIETGEETQRTVIYHNDGTYSSRNELGVYSGHSTFIRELQTTGGETRPDDNFTISGDAHQIGDGTWSGSANNTLTGEGSDLTGPGWPWDSSMEFNSGGGGGIWDVSFSTLYTTAQMKINVNAAMSEYDEEPTKLSLLQALGGLVGQILSADESTFSTGKAKYVLKFNRAVPGTLKWLEVFYPLDNTLTQIDESANISVIKKRSSGVGDNTESDEEYEVDGTAFTGNGGAALVLAPSLMVISSEGGGAFLDDEEKAAGSAKLPLGDSSGAVSFYVPYYGADTEVTLTWNETHIRVYRSDGMEMSSGDPVDGAYSYYVVAKDGAPAGYSTDISMDVLVNGANWGSDSFAVTVADDAPKDYTLPVDDASGPRYRKVALNGRPMSDEKPQHTAESDQEKEETFIDAMTLGLRHSVTDIYVPIAGSDLTLSARRNAESSAWTTRNGLRPHERPDRPFGLGWSSSLAPTVEFVTVTGEPVYAYVADENGTRHRFLQWTDVLGKHYAPMPTAQPENGDYLASFDGVTFKSRYGTEITFESVEGGLEVATDRWFGSDKKETHKYMRATSVQDRLGKIINFSFTGQSLIPDTIAVAGSLTQHISIMHDARGLVTDIWDPNGLQTHFDYEDKAYTDNGLNYTASVLRQVTRQNGATTHYQYELTTESDPLPPKPGDKATPRLHLELASITDPNTHTYGFTYQWDESKMNYDSAAGYYRQPGLPRWISRVDLPDGGFATFSNESLLKLAYDGTTPKLTLDSHRRTVVTDAENNFKSTGKKTTYVWSDVQIFAATALRSLYQDPVTIPKIVYYKALTVTYADLGSEQYTFDLSAGLAVKSVLDLSGNLTSFTYGDDWMAPADYRVLFTLDGLNGKYSDPTQQTNAMTQSRHFVYGDWRIMKQMTDEENRVTDNEVDPQGRRTRETIFDAGGAKIQETFYEYSTTFPGVVTKKRVTSVANSGDPAWVGELVTRYDLDGNGRVSHEIVDPDGLHLDTASTYDANGNKLTSTDPLGRTTYFGYDALNRLVGVAYADGTEKTMGYDLRGNKSFETDEKGHTSKFFYDEMNRLREQWRLMADGGKLVTKYGYNKVGSRISIEDPNQHTTQTEYDYLQRPSWTKDAENRQTIFTYGANSGGKAFDSSGFKPTQIQDPRGVVTVLTNDALYRTTDKVVTYAPLQAAWTHLTYDNVGNMLTETDGLLKTTTRTYDALNRVKTTTFQDQKSQIFGYTSTGLKWRVVDELNRETTTEYDRAGRPVAVNAPALPGRQPIRTSTEYDDNGNVRAVTDALLRRTDFTYDKRNRKVREEGPAVVDGLTGVAQRPLTDWEYDAVGNVSKVTDPRNYVTSTEYDNANRKITVTAPPVPVVGEAAYVSPITQMTYDGAGNVQTVTDPNGYVTINTYYPTNRLWTSKDGANITVTNEYDEVGNRTAVIDGKNQRTEFTYDGLNRNLTIKTPLGKITTFVYDAVNKTTRVDANTRTTSYGYDDRHRLTSVQYTNQGTQNRAYQYDFAGRLESVTEADPSGKADVSYTYDAMNRVLTETSGGVLHTYTYDDVGNRLTTVYGDTNRLLVSTYDNLNRLDTVTESPLVNGGRLTSYHYDLAGNVIQKVLPNGDAINTIYDGLNRSAKITGVSAAGQTLYQYAPAHDRDGNARAIAEKSVGIADRYLEMTYDGTDRLLTEKDTSSGVPKLTTYTYDDANNRASRTRSGFGGEPSVSYTYDDGNRLTSLTEGARNVLYGYDNNGNRMTRTENGVVNATYGYDRENRLTNLSQDGHNYAYTYDYRTRRVERAEDAVATKVIFSGGTSVQEKENNATTVEYVRGSDWGGGVGGILYTLRAGTPSFTHYDSRGDVTAKTDNTGAVTYQASYEAFGKRTQELGATADRQKANTKEEDPTGLLNEGMRYRDLETGTFITADPAGFVDGPNLYAYVKQNPWTMFDPEGLTGENFEEFEREEREASRTEEEEFKEESERWREQTTRGSVEDRRRQGEWEEKLHNNEEEWKKSDKEDKEAAQKGESPIERITRRSRTNDSGIDGKPEGPSAKDVSAAKKPVRPGDRGAYGSLKAQKKTDGETEPLDMDHRPSYAAQKKALEDRLGRELTPKEAKELKDNTPAVATPRKDHQTESRTYGARNTKEQIADDAKDLEKARRLDDEKMGD